MSDVSLTSLYDYPPIEPERGADPYASLHVEGRIVEVDLSHLDRKLEAVKALRRSLVSGVAGLFVLGIVLGPVAISSALKAESLGYRATAGKTLGWIDVVLGAVWVGVLAILAMRELAGV